MIGRVAAPLIFLVGVLATMSTAEVLYTLTSRDQEAHGYFGYSVSGAGDVNGDGYDDVVVGAYEEDPGSSPSSAGRAYVFDGRKGTFMHTLISPNEEYGGFFGSSVSGAGDVNGDGYDDVIVGAHREDPGLSPYNAGRAYVFDGRTGNPIHTLVSPNEEVEGSFGYSISSAGDVNGNGYDDVVVGAYEEDPGSSPNLAGRAYVFDGEMGNLLHTLVSPNQQVGSQFGFSVSGAGDANGDGYDDVAVGARGEDPGSSPDGAGRAYVFDGHTSNLLHTLVSPNEESSGWFGFSVSGAVDVDGDGYDDVVVGAILEDPGSSPDFAGRAYVFDGETGDLLHTLVSPNEEWRGYFGYSVSGVGDVNGDGYDDVVVGAYHEDPGSSPEDAGRAYVFDGWTGDPIQTLVSPNEEAYGNLGYSVSSAGDVNGDGSGDVVVGAYGEDPGSSPVGAGRAYVYSWMNLSSSLSGGALELQWSTWPMASEYWVHGADNLAYFVPSGGNQLAVVPSGTITWSSSAGVGDPENNWTYLVISVDGSENELARTNRVGEGDYGYDIP